MSQSGNSKSNMYYLYVVIVCLLLAILIWIFFYNKLRQTDRMIIETREKQLAKIEV